MEGGRSKFLGRDFYELKITNYEKNVLGHETTLINGSYINGLKYHNPILVFLVSFKPRSRAVTLWLRFLLFFVYILMYK
jgi:hypothetical protein